MYNKMLKHQTFPSTLSNQTAQSALCSEELTDKQCNDPKFSDTQKICCNHSKVWTMWLYHRVMNPNDADGMANSVDPDQTAPLAAVWSGSALFAQAYLAKNLGSLW